MNVRCVKTSRYHGNNILLQIAIEFRKPKTLLFQMRLFFDKLFAAIRTLQKKIATFLIIQSCYFSFFF